MLGHLFVRGGWAAALLLVAALGLWAASAWQEGASAALADHGVAATATLVEKRQVAINFIDPKGRGSRRGRDYLAIYEFPATRASGERTVERFEDRLTAAAFAAVEVGDTLAVRYLPEDPSRFERGEGATAAEAGALGWIAAAMAGLAAVILGLAWGPARRAALRATAPLRATAVVDKVWGDRLDVALRVRFTDAQGIERRAVVPSVQVARRGDLKPGSSLAILYDPRDLGSARLDHRGGNPGRPDAR